MLDSFEIISASGVVLWSRSYAPVGAHIVNGLINDVFIEEKIHLPDTGAEGATQRYKKEKYTLRWTRSKDLGLLFVAVYQSLLHLTWIDELLENIKTIFIKLYKEQLKGPRSRVVEYPFDPYFDHQLQKLENATGPTVEDGPRLIVEEKKDTLADADTGGPPPPPIPGLLPAQPRAAQVPVASEDTTPSMSPGTSRSASPAPRHIITGKLAPGGRVSRRARKAANATNAPQNDDSPKKGKPVKGGQKKMRKWGVDGLAEEDDGEILDYSAADTNAAEATAGTQVEAVDSSSWGTKTAKGQFVLKDLGEEVQSILQKADQEKAKSNPPNGIVSTGLGAISGLFRNVIGGKILTKPDLEKPLKAMEEHLLKKNVAREAAVRLCEGVEQELIGKKTGSFQSIDSALRSAMESSLRKILTPTSSLDLLREIEAVTSPRNKQQGRRPYVISIVGVNGVGKSTNLSKICFFLLQNNYKVLIAACDTFRSGAVEQLRVHARNLKELSERENVGQIELYEKGYGKDAANVAKDAVAYAANNTFDVVLIDTAGRRHNDQRLMSSLEKFAKFAAPDKIFMVGEALVGTDSVMQARNFNQAFGTGRGLDGFIISKCDTVGDMVGTLVSMVHATGIPIVFLGVGQHYGDLRGLSVPWAVGLLMK
ncbi:hypothetical protein PRK78_006977 [Emydomyces testavorans]|uniref:Signal recognition particle receptor subunit alpha homolog n=1 Tax=Emydomyces testavorans TaxID=2070801 RepID=A0AAF0DMU2_9EURO|nr:hypothetical protein PRK78_006977 [Emydomyces testavorans]